MRQGIATMLFTSLIWQRFVDLFSTKRSVPTSLSIYTQGALLVDSSLAFSCGLIFAFLIGHISLI